MYRSKFDNKLPIHINPKLRAWALTGKYALITTYIHRKVGRCGVQNGLSSIDPFSHFRMPSGYTAA